MEESHLTNSVRSPATLWQIVNRILNATLTTAPAF
jgi:hypothetical protein